MQLSKNTEARVQSGQVATSKVQRYKAFVDRINNELLKHPVIVDNQFSRWFSSAELTKEEVRHFLVQFSVFSNLFLVAQLKKTLNSPSLEAMRTSKEILMNETGVLARV